MNFSINYFVGIPRGFHVLNSTLIRQTQAGARYLAVWYILNMCNNKVVLTAVIQQLKLSDVFVGRGKFRLAEKMLTQQFIGL